MSEALQSDPSVTIAGETATVSSSGNDYTATYDVTSSSTEGTVTYDIGALTDTSSNIYDPTETTTTITIDRTAPVITLVGPATMTINAGDTYQELGSSADNGESVTITGTVNTQIAGTYTLSYSVTDAAGNEGTAQRTVVVASKAPSAPESLTVSARAPTTITLSWTTPFNGGSTITKYQIKQDTGSYADISGSDESTTSYTVTGLSEETEYTFSVRAVNTDGGGAESSVTTTTTDGTAPALIGTPIS